MADTTQTITSALRYIDDIEWPEQIRTFADEGALPTPPEYTGGVPQVVTVGSQIAEFAAGVPAEIRADISNSFLLAQLAADHWMETHEGTDKTWYNVYLKVMSNCGWVVEERQSSIHAVTGDSAKVHAEIISVLTVALGPAVQAASLIVSVLKGLKAMSADQPFITLFEHASQRAEAKLFQISYVAIEEGQTPRIRLAAYDLDAAASLTQFLFFKLSLNHARLKSHGADLSINADIFNAVRGAVRDKVKARIEGNIAGIEI